jgi:undecaprenyl-diphosphatase
MLPKILDFDYRMSSHLRMKETRGIFRGLTVFFAHSGDSWFWLAALFLIWLFAKGHWHTLSSLMAVGLLGLAVLVLLIKFTVRRRRPEGEWGAIYRNTDPHSFPSGHAARAVFLAVLALGLGPLWFGLLLLIWAPLVALARVSLGVHYLSDIVAGMLLGVIAGLAMLGISPWLIQTFPFPFIK